MSDAVKVKDHNNLRRDPYSQAIINVDKQEYVAYLKKQQRAQRLEQVESKVYDMQNDIKDIKQMLQQLVSK
jgi:heat shock protein HspQ